MMKSSVISRPVTVAVPSSFMINSLFYCSLASILGILLFPKITSVIRSSPFASFALAQVQVDLRRTTSSRVQVPEEWPHAFLSVYSSPEVLTYVSHFALPMSKIWLSDLFYSRGKQSLIRFARIQLEERALWRDGRIRYTCRFCHSFHRPNFAVTEGFASRLANLRQLDLDSLHESSRFVDRRLCRRLIHYLSRNESDGEDFRHLGDSKRVFRFP